MPDFVGLRNLLMYEVTTNSSSAFFRHINRPYVDPRYYIDYRQVPFGSGRLPRTAHVEPKFP